MKLYKEPLVSIAMTTYNHKKFIAKAIDSALAQDYTNIEIVISDDHSTDDTVDIVKGYTKIYPNKVLLLTSKKNMGVTNNWFKSVSACKGKYIAGLAGDDEFLPEFISKQVEMMESDHDITVSYADASVFHVPTQKELYRLSDKTPTKSGGIEIALGDSLYYSPSTMFRKKFVPKANIFKEIKHASDLAFYKEMMILSAPNGKIHYMPEVLYKYQKHDNNITVSSWRYHKEHIEAIKILQKKYPKYSEYLNGSIYDFCCVALFKSLFKFKFNDAYYFLHTGLRASKGNPLKFFRAVAWGINFTVKKLL